MKRLLLIMALALVACGQQLPKPECDPGTNYSGSGALPCDEAVRAALGALPASHPLITRIQFVYGSLQPWAPAFPGDQPIEGYVVFTWADGSRRQYVEVTAWHGGTKTGIPQPY